MTTRTHRLHFRHRTSVLICLLIFGLTSYILPALAGDENQNEYPDQAGRDALRLWSEKEMDREVSEALRKYWDYWHTRQKKRYSAYRLWYELEETQRWLKDPEHNPPPPPPPDNRLPHPYPHPYPYMYYPPPWAYGPLYPPPYQYPYLYPASPKKQRK